MDKLTPMMRQYHEIKCKHPQTLIFFRLGDFYEMFYEDAVVASRVLEITLTSRHADRSGKPIPMCGVPHHALNAYLARLVKKGHRVAIVEQMEAPSQAKGLVRREVARIVTPGTAIEEGILESGENNFVASLVEGEGSVGAAFLDLSTGEFWAAEFTGDEAWSQMQQQFLHFTPAEVILPEEERPSLAEKLPADLRGALLQTPQPDWTFTPDYAQRTLLTHFRVASLDGFGLSGHPSALAAAGALLTYARQMQKAPLSHVVGLRFLEPARFLKMDDATVQNLELVRGLDGNRKWTLLETLDLTHTGMGSRALRSWILRPSLDLEEIQGRLDAVEELLASAVHRGRLEKVLDGVQDVERLLSRITLETAGPRDLLSLKASLKALPSLRELLKDARASLLPPPEDHLEDVVDLLERAVDEKAPALVNDGGLVRPGFHAELDELREVARSGKSFIARLEAQERERTGISNLRVKYNRVFGYFIEVTRAQLPSVPSHYQRKQTLAGAERFITPDLKEWEEKVLGAEEKILALEKEIFLDIRRRVAAEAPRVQRAAAYLATLDVLVALAEAAHRYRYVRPQLDASQDLSIKAGRHPVVELESSEPFVPNDLYCNSSGDQLLILTGPNMGGKSTYLRQNALIVIMAQMGSFVPAEEARIGLVDRVFTRVGASDNLARGRSTFMVEMIETANILNTATPRSLVLLDEVGRGTATFDGLSIAWAVAEYLCTEPQRRARTLFATHYQELTRLADFFEGVKNYCVTVRESGGKIIFFHRIMAGVASRSYGIEVARLAGLPAAVVERAREVLSRLERKQLNLTAPAAAPAFNGSDAAELQKALF